MKNCFHYGVIAILLLSGCSIAPTTPRIDAESLEQGDLKLSAWASPSLAGSLAYGATDKLDIGVDVEQLTTINLWAKYSLISSDNFSAAATAGVFKGSALHDTKGYFLGSVINRNVTDTVNLFAHYRFSNASYQPLDKENDSSLTDDEVWWGIDSRDAMDLSRTSQLSVGINWQVATKMNIQLGFGCQHHHRNDDPATTTNPCAPLLGVSF